MKRQSSILRQPLSCWRKLAMVFGLACLTWGASGQTVAQWPLPVLAGPYTLTMYEPRIEEWSGEEAAGRAVLAVAAARQEPVFGTIWFHMRLDFNPARSVASIREFQVETIRLPAESSLSPEQIVDILRRGLPNRHLAAAGLRQSYLREQAERERWQGLVEQPLSLAWSPRPTVVVEFDGEPRLHSLPATSLLHAVNTESLVLFDTRSRRWYLALADHWRTAESLADEWLPLEGTPDFLAEVEQEFALFGDAETDPETLVLVTERPLAVVETDGRPVFEEIANTDLFHVINTDADLFFSLDHRQYYTLIGGRWFSAVSLEDGPWAELSPTELPEGFVEIPFDHPKYAVLAHIPGTPLAAEAFYDAQTPIVHGIERDRPLEIEVEYIGEPRFETIETTNIYYAVNTRHSIVRVQSDYYLCHEGGWYRGRSPRGPWLVTVAVPSVIYSIPAYHPFYPLTFVRVYDWSPTRVYVGYTGGYLGWVGYRGYQSYSRGLVINFSLIRRPVHYQTTVYPTYRRTYSRPATSFPSRHRSARNWPSRTTRTRPVASHRPQPQNRSERGEPSRSSRPYRQSDRSWHDSRREDRRPSSTGEPRTPHSPPSRNGSMPTATLPSSFDWSPPVREPVRFERRAMPSEPTPATVSPGTRSDQGPDSHMRVRQPLGRTPNQPESTGFPRVENHSQRQRTDSRQREPSRGSDNSRQEDASRNWRVESNRRRTPASPDARSSTARPTRQAPPPASDSPTSGMRRSQSEQTSAESSRRIDSASRSGQGSPRRQPQEQPRSQNPSARHAGGTPGENRVASSPPPPVPPLPIAPAPPRLGPAPARPNMPRPSRPSAPGQTPSIFGHSREADQTTPATVSSGTRSDQGPDSHMRVRRPLSR